MDIEAFAYRRRVADLFTGSSLGNLATFARLDEKTDLLGLWSALDNQFYVGQWDVEIVADGIRADPLETTFRPVSQSTVLEAPGVKIEKSFFLPLSEFRPDKPPPPMSQTGIYQISLTNNRTVPVDLVIKHTIVFPAVRTLKFTKQANEDQFTKSFDVEQAGNAFTVTTRTRQSEVRVFGSGEACDSMSSDKRSLAVSYRFALNGGAKKVVPFVLAYSPAGVGAAYDILTATLANCRMDGHESPYPQATAQTVFEHSRDAMKSVLERSRIVCPDPVINRGMQWAKVNTVRVEHQFRAGAGFTNDPPQDIVVIRDLAWFVLGADYFTPSFSRALIEFAEQYAYHEGGKLTEFLHADEKHPEQHDYKLNINDDTPLFVYALYHHALVSGDQNLLSHFYPLMKRASDWILAQVRDGLVSCVAEGTNVWGICSWRNIIDGYNLTGAVTEVNAECCHALMLTARAAERLGMADDARRYRTEGEALRTAVNTRLVSEKTGLYLLNRDAAGVAHHDVTADLVFPLMFGIADNDRAKRIKERLFRPDLWTSFGARTVAPGEPMYDPDFGYQLVGGVWPNLTAWIAYASRDEMPGRVAEAMHNIYAMCEAERPADFKNLVPGEFPERLHGTTFESRGMAMSPWMPATYVWLGVEGLLGVTPSWDRLDINPALPDDWKWIMVRELAYRGEFIDVIWFNGRLYSSSARVQSMSEVICGVHWQSVSSNADVVSIALEIGDEMHLFVASPTGGIASISIARDGVRRSAAQQVRVELAAGEARLIRLAMTALAKGKERVGYDVP